MTIGILKENEPETRVSILAEHINDLRKVGFERILVEKGAGEHVHNSDSLYEEAGAELRSRDEILEAADLVVVISLPDATQLPANPVYVSQINPLAKTDTVKSLAEKGLTVFSMDMVPRTTKAQAMDVLSSMATSAGYKAILTAAVESPRFFPMFMTAAGTIAPAKVLILGAGVAGLQAISTARRLGAVVEAFDVRAAAKEEVMSLGAKFVEVEGARDDASAGGYAVEQTAEYQRKQAELIQEHAKKADVIICTAQIPGRPAPKLITEETIKKMKPGSVIVDLAASTGGNSAFTENDRTVVVNGVKIIGNSNLPATIAVDSSKMYGKNLINFFKELVTEEGINLDFSNEIIQHTCITHEGKVISPRILEIINK